MNEKVEFSEESLREIAEQKIRYRLGVKIHFAVFILVNILLVIINIFTQPYGYRFYWFIFPFLAWFIGLIMHIVAYVLYARGVYPMAKRGVIFHFFAYLTVNLLLFAIDTNVWQNFTFHRIYWAYYPAFFWGIALILHAIVYSIFLSGKLTPDGVGKTKKERMIEKEMQKIRKKMNEENR